MGMFSKDEANMMVRYILDTLKPKSKTTPSLNAMMAYNRKTNTILHKREKSLQYAIPELFRVIGKRRNLPEGYMYLVADDIIDQIRIEIYNRFVSTYYDIVDPLEAIYKPMVDYNKNGFSKILSYMRVLQQTIREHGYYEDIDKYERLASCFTRLDYYNVKTLDNYKVLVEFVNKNKIVIG